ELARDGRRDRHRVLHREDHEVGRRGGHRAVARLAVVEAAARDGRDARAGRTQLVDRAVAAARVGADELELADVLLRQPHLQRAAEELAPVQRGDDERDLQVGPPPRASSGSSRAARSSAWLRHWSLLWYS